jgi:uncharacterized protein (TIGR03437 family)
MVVTASSWRICRSLTRLAMATLLFIALAFAADPAEEPIRVTVSSETAPAGSVVQIKFSLDRLQAVSNGALTVDFDAAFFGDVSAVSAFSSAGDAHGSASVEGRRVTVRFASSSGSLGVIRGLPIVAVTVPVLPGLPEGAKTEVRADPGAEAWRDAAYNPRGVALTPGVVTIGGSPSVREVQPASGRLPAGAIVRVLGSGFTPSTSADIVGVSVSSVQFFGSDRIDLTLGGPAEIGGKRVRLQNADGATVDFFPAWSANPDELGPGDWPILPLYANTSAETADLARRQVRLTVQNPNATTVEVAVQEMEVSSVTSQRVLTIPAGAAVHLPSGFGGGGGRLRVLASAPVRSVALWTLADRYAGGIVGRGSAPLLPVVAPPVQFPVSTDSLTWTLQPGSAKPAPKTFTVYGPYEAAPTRFTVSIVTESGGNWLSAAPLSGTSSAQGTAITTAIDPAALAPGIYRGTLTVTPEPSSLRVTEPTTVVVALTVSASRFPNTVLACCHEFGSHGFSSTPHTYLVSSEVIPGAFTTTVLTDSGGNWLSVRPSSGAAPASLAIAVDPANLSPGRYSGEVFITGSGNLVYMPVVLWVSGGVQLKADTFLLQFNSESDKSPPPQSTRITTQCADRCPATVPDAIPWTASVKTNSGGNWLSAGTNSGELLASVNSKGLAPGAYTGAVTLMSPAASGPTQIPVVLVVQSTAVPAIAASQPALYLRVPGRGFPSRKIVCVKAGVTDVPVSATASTADGGDWLSVSPPVWFTQSCVEALIDPGRLAPGVYNGKLNLSAAGQSLSVPVKVGIDSPSPPFLGSAVNAASAASGAVAPGEIVTLRGLNIGPDRESQFPPGMLKPPQVFFAGMPAMVLFASGTQINAVAPEQLGGMTAASVEVRYAFQSAGWTLPVTAVAPGIFTLDSSGQGPAAVLNQDNSVNGSSNPAPRGSVVQIFATGLASPEGQSVSAAIGGVDAPVTFAGPAPGSAQGLFQVNARVPLEAPAGPAIPIVLRVGHYRSSDGVTVAVQ